MAVTDTFERASLGANWDTGLGSLTNIVITGSSDAHAENTSSDAGAIYDAETWDDDQASKIVLGDTPGNSDYVGCIVRGAADGDCYVLSIDGGEQSNTLALYTLVNGGGWTSEGTSAEADPFSGDDYEADITGQNASISVALKINGTTELTVNNPGTSYNSGIPGIQHYRTSGTVGLESWTGTGEVAAGAALPRPPLVVSRAVPRASSW